MGVDRWWRGAVLVACIAARLLGSVSGIAALALPARGPFAHIAMGGAVVLAVRSRGWPVGADAALKVAFWPSTCAVRLRYRTDGKEDP
jgi:hypothetical protein